MRYNLSLRLRLALLITILMLAAAAVPRSMPQTDQENERKNPYAGNAEATQLGRSFFRIDCALCHGIDARGGRGPDLTTGQWAHGESDAAIFKTISKGVPGSEMPPANFTDDEVWMIVAFLRSLSVNPGVSIQGSREAGEKIFAGEGLCQQCHMAQGRGGRLGPDLSRIGATRSVPYLIESLREPGKEILRGFETVTAVTSDGRRITGARKNEDNYSLQLMDHKEELHLLLKRDLRDVISDEKSLMPTYDGRVLNETKLQDLVAYLVSLRGK